MGIRLSKKKYSWTIQRLNFLNILDYNIKSRIFRSCSNIKSLMYFGGFGYKAHYQNMMSFVKTFGLNNVSGTVFEAGKEFTIALRAVEGMSSQYQKQIGKNILAQILSMIQFNQIWTTVTECLQMAIYHQGRISDDSRGQNMGKALGFLNKAQQMLSPIINVKNANKIYQPDQLDQLKQLNQQLTQQLTESNYKNQQIYYLVCIRFCTRNQIKHYTTHISNWIQEFSEVQTTSNERKNIFQENIYESQKLQQQQPINMLLYYPCRIIPVSTQKKLLKLIA